MKKTSMRTIPLAFAAALALSSAWAQTPGAGSSTTGGGAAPAAQPGTGTRNAETRKDDKLATTDRKFIQEAAEGGMFEVDVGKLASSKASDPEVKSFGSMLADQHSAANKELVQLANSKKVELPAAPPHSMRRELEKLAKLNGKEFDQHFIREVGIKDHQQDIKKFQAASGKVKDPELKAWIDKTLPTLREHLAHAQKLQGGDAAAMGNRAGPGGTGGGTGANKTGS